MNARWNWSIGLLASAAILAVSFAASPAATTPTGDEKSGDRESADAATNNAAASDENRMVVHEWGTFTCLQGDDGRELPGVNIDDEPVPDFVHNLNPYLLNQPLLTNAHWLYRQKGAPRNHPQITMRLETPVIYFYPPKNQPQPLTVNVDVRFQGGWLTEFYPNAKADAPGLDGEAFDFGNLTPQTVGSLAWSDLKVGDDPNKDATPGPQTDEHVWLAPRQVDAASVTTPEGERERYLFYRGVGNLRAPLRVVRGQNRNELKLYGNFDAVVAAARRLRIEKLWLADIRQSGTKFRAYGAVNVTGDPFAQVGQLDGDLSSAEQGLDNLKRQMHRSLIAAGLFDKEATAMLSTWDRAYFQSPGLRLFFVVPREWTDRVLPLSISTPASIKRVMMARIELITDDQRELLAAMAKTAPSDGKWLEGIQPGEASKRFYAGRANFGDLGVKIPADYQTYLDLGRFRNALVVAEERRQPSENLTRFINTYGLQPFRVPSRQKDNVAAQP
ncbi:MAG: hypothetical protein WD875_08980 [Pirellulales bacterium]